LRRRRRVFSEWAGEYAASRGRSPSLGLRREGEEERGREDFAGDFFRGRREGTSECGVKRAWSGRRNFY